MGRTPVLWATGPLFRDQSCGAGSTRWPEPHLCLICVASYAALIAWLWSEMSRWDFGVFSGVYILCFPVLFSSTTPRLLACLGGPICGLVAGMQLIDLVFDLCILQDQPLTDGVETFEARRLAFVYYRAVLRATHVNAVLLAIILICFLGSIVGMQRTSPALRWRWVMLGACMSVGTSGYLGVVVTRYLAIRSAPTFDTSLFDGWERVLVARMVLYASLGGSLPVMFELQGIKDEEVQTPGKKTL
mmetsp:Transcript_9933/g.22305  ORF Transcript_9933/g.22305 Transcript_9933/m.22305 type:complete len:245 (-) Transcript_9933:15-749(-)